VISEDVEPGDGELCYRLALKKAARYHVLGQPYRSRDEALEALPEINKKRAEKGHDLCNTLLTVHARDANKVSIGHPIRAERVTS